jgi:ABC-2 type transport system permease protein
MVFARQSMMMNEGVSAVLYLFCGVVFPPDLLPAFLKPVALALPMTYWLEASRRAFDVHGFSPLLARLTDLQLAAIFVAVAFAWLVAARWIFGRLERRARAEGCSTSRPPGSEITTASAGKERGMDRGDCWPSSCCSHPPR